MNPCVELPLLLTPCTCQQRNRNMSWHRNKGNTHPDSVAWFPPFHTSFGTCCRDLLIAYITKIPRAVFEFRIFRRNKMKEFCRGCWAAVVHWHGLKVGELGDKWVNGGSLLEAVGPELAFQPKWETRFPLTCFHFPLNFPSTHCIVLGKHTSPQGSHSGPFPRALSLVSTSGTGPRGIYYLRTPEGQMSPNGSAIFIGGKDFSI